MDVRLFSSFITQSTDRRDQQRSAQFERRLGKIFAASAAGDFTRAIRLAQGLLHSMYTWPAAYLAPSNRQRARYWFIFARLQCRRRDWTSAFETVCSCIQSIPHSEALAYIDAHALFSEIAAALDYFEQSRVSLTVVLDGLPIIAAQHGPVTDLRCLLLAKRAIRHVARSAFDEALADIREAAQIFEEWLASQGVRLRGRERLLPHAVVGDTKTVPFERYPARLQQLPSGALHGIDAHATNWRYAAVMIPWCLGFMKYWWARGDLHANQTELPECFHLVREALIVGQNLIPDHVFLVRAVSLLTDIPAAASWPVEFPGMRYRWLGYSSAGMRQTTAILANFAQDPHCGPESQLVMRLAVLQVEVMRQRLSPTPNFTPVIRDVNLLRRDAQHQTNRLPGVRHLVARCLLLLSAIYAMTNRRHTAYVHAHLALQAFTHQTSGEAFLPRVQSTRKFMSTLAKPIF